MKAVYTTCSFNHIGRALSLEGSVFGHSPDTRFFIGLIDQTDDLPEKEGHEFISAADIGIPYFGEMCAKYGPMELSSALKPFFADHIFRAYPEITEMIYLDSDILVFHDLQVIFDHLETHSILLTPHTFTSIASGNGYDDRNFLRCGVYNAGFFAVKNSVDGRAFLNWWMGKLRNEGFYDSKRGMFADQLWLNLVPVYFNGVKILVDPGCNVAYWNLHERQITKKDGKFFVNGDRPLVFYHFSGAAMDCLDSDRLSVHHKAYSFTARPDVRPLFEQYIDELTSKEFGKYSAYYTVNSRIKVRSPLLIRFLGLYKSLLKRLIYAR